MFLCSNGLIRCCSVLLLAPAAAAQAHKLNGPLPQTTRSDVGAFAIGPNGFRVAYLADQDHDGVQELFALPVDRSQPPVRINDPLGNGSWADVVSFQFAPAGGRIVFRADLEQDEAFQLYSAEVDGSGVPIRLNGTLVTGGDVSGYFISPDGTRVVYLADQDTDGVVELYSVPVDGSQPAVKISPSLTAGGEVTGIRLSADSARVVFLSDYLTDERFLLVSVPMTGGSVTVLNGPLAAGGDVQEFELTPQGRAIYLADQEVNGTAELYSAPITGGSWTKLSTAEVNRFRISANGARVVFRTSSGLWGVNPVSGPPVMLSGPAAYGFWVSPDGAHVVFQTGLGMPLYSVPSTGGTPVQISPPDPYVQSEDRAPRISPNSSLVVYGVNRNTVLEIHSVPITGGAATRLSAPMAPGGAIFRFDFSPDGNRVLYRADQDVNDALELFSVPITGGPVVQVNGPLVAGGDVSEYAISPTGIHVVYRADQDQDETQELYSSPIAGGAVVKLNSPLPLSSSGSIQQVLLSPDGRHAVYVGYQDQPDVLEIYSVDLGPGFRRTKLNGPFAPNGGIDPSSSTPLISPDSTRVVYLADEDGHNGNELFSVRIDGTQPPVEIGGDASAFAVTPDSALVVFLVNGTLSSIAIDGGASIVLDGAVAAFALSPDGSTVVFRSPASQLFAIAVTGGAPLVLSGSTSDVAEFVISPAGTAVAFLARDATFLELFGTPLDGSAPPVKLNPPLLGFDDVQADFQISLQDRAVFVAPTGSPSFMNLYSRPIDGSGPAELLSSGISSGLDSPRITADGSRVAFVTFDANLYSVPIGGGNPLLLGSGRYPPVFTPDGARVLSTWFLGGAPPVRLLSVPTDGSAPQIEINGPLVSGGRVESLFGTGAIPLTSIGQMALYLADAEIVGRRELYAVPVAGGEPPLKLNGPLIPAGDVCNCSGAIATAGSAVAYLADQDEDGVNEAYVSLIPRPTLRAPVPGRSVSATVTGQ